MIKQTIERVTGITFAQICEKCRKPDYVDARMIYVYYARNAGEKTEKIGRDIHRTHSVACRLYKKYRDDYRFNPVFRAKAKKVEEILKNQNHDQEKNT